VQRAKKQGKRIRRLGGDGEAFSNEHASQTKWKLLHIERKPVAFGFLSNIFDVSLSLSDKMPTTRLEDDRGAEKKEICLGIG
jgi:hypothetical protein